MRRSVLLVLLVFLSLEAQDFSAFLDRIYRAPMEAKAALVDSFLNAQPSFPVIEKDTLVHFIYTGQANSVTVPGDANQWDANSDRLTRIYGTDLWYLSKHYESDARLDYKFVVNGSNWILDPRNKNTCQGGFGPNSELRMPAYQFPEEILYRSSIPHGSFFDTSFYSSNLKNSRQIRVYLPPGYPQAVDSCGFILFHDGLEFVSLAYANNVLDYLIYQRTIEPVIAVFVPPVSRTAEYAGNLRSQFTDFIIGELVPWLYRKYPIRRAPQWHATLGASNGGNIALWLGVSHPEVFGKVGAFSSNVQSDITNILSSSQLLPLQFYLDIGTYDIAVLIPLVRNLKSLLETKGYPLTYYEWHEGHSWGNWRAHVDIVLTQFFPRTTGVRSVPAPKATAFSLSHYPNPFNRQITFQLSISSNSEVNLQIFDLQGRLVSQLFRGVLPIGNYHFTWTPTAVASGVYLYQLRCSGQMQMGKMLFIQ